MHHGQSWGKQKTRKLGKTHKSNENRGTFKKLGGNKIPANYGEMYQFCVGLNMGKVKNLELMTKKGHQRLWRIEIWIFFRKRQNFRGLWKWFGNRGNSETEGNASLPLGMDAPHGEDMAPSLRDGKTIADKIFECLTLLSEIWYITYMTLFLTKNLYFRTKHSSMTLLVSSYFASHPITVLLEFSKYWGDGRIIRPHTSNFFLGTVSPKSPPVCVREKAHATACLCMHVDCSLKKNCGNRHKAKSCWKFNTFCTFL